MGNNIGYYAETNIVLEYDRGGHYDTETSVTRTGWPDRGEWFDTLEEAKAFVRDEVADLASRFDGGYSITRLVSEYDSVEYVLGTVERDELDENGDPIDSGDVVYERDSRPWYVIDAMEKVRRNEDLADRIAQVRGEGWKLVITDETGDEEWRYFTSQLQVDDEVALCGLKVIRTEDMEECRATLHITYCE